ncbi:MAG: helix-turn-helix domain-containing protein [Clostridia bacterium]|nr:helix-turn-helix domain-containing protein [Clostridia bacterium]
MITHQIANSQGNYNFNAFIYTDSFWDSHFHRNYELIYTIEGKTEISINGVKDCLNEGELLLISPYTVHSLRVTPPSKAFVEVFSEDFISSFAEKNRFVRFSKFRCSPSAEQALKQSLFTESPPEFYQHISCLYSVCNECVKNAVFDTVGQDNRLIEQVISYISEHLSDGISLQDIAKALNYEYHYFSGLFHQCFHMNFKNFINLFRFEKACKLLKEKNSDITSVCGACGFGSIRNFNRVFKSISGYTPSQYQKRTE